MFLKPSVTPLIAALVVKRPVHFQDSPAAIVTNQEIHLAALAIRFRLQPNLAA